MRENANRIGIRLGIVLVPMEVKGGMNLLGWWKGLYGQLPQLSRLAIQAFSITPFSC